jgi:DNA uptake protein ComE-like DNA-binding protein
MCIECEDEVVKSKNDVSIVEVQKNQKGEVSEKNVSKIKVDIKGAVKKEGVYELDSGSRVIDVVNLAGGLKSNASTKYLNLSKLLSDEMIVNVFTTSQVKNMSVKEEIKEECICPVLDCSKCFNSTIIDGNSNNDLVPDQNIESNNKISLNNSTKEELMTLTILWRPMAKISPIQVC